MFSKRSQDTETHNAVRVNLRLQLLSSHRLFPTPLSSVPCYLSTLGTPSHIVSNLPFPP